MASSQNELTLHSILQQPAMLLRFKYYLAQNLAEENLTFLQMLAEMRTAHAENPHASSVVRDIKLIIDEFFGSSSPMELNLPSKVRAEAVTASTAICKAILEVDSSEVSQRTPVNFQALRNVHSIDEVITQEQLLQDPFLIFFISETHIKGVLNDRVKGFSKELQKDTSSRSTAMVHTPTSKAIRVVILGGGFCGSMVAQSLEPMSMFSVILIDAKSYFEYTPSVVRIIPDPKADNIMYDHNQYIKNGQLVVSMVDDVFPTHVTAGNGQHVIPFDYLVVASGSSYTSNIKADHISSNYRTKKIMSQHVKLIEAKSVICVGGGSVGIELAGEIKCVYPDKKVTLIDANSRLMKRADPRVHNMIAKYLTELGVELVLNERLTVFEEGKNDFIGKSGKRYNADMVYMCTGQVPRSGIMKSHFGDLLNPSGYINVKLTHQLPGYDNIYAGGDVCAIGDERMAAAARLAAICIARNICRTVKGKSPISRGSKQTRPISIKPPIQIISLGTKTSVLMLNCKQAIMSPKFLVMKQLFKEKTWDSFSHTHDRMRPFAPYMKLFYGRPPRALFSTDNTTEDATTKEPKIVEITETTVTIAPIATA